MKTNTKLAMLASMALLIGSAPAPAQTAPGPGPGGPVPHARFGEMLQVVIKQYDANQDGQLDSAEINSLETAVAAGQVTPPGAPGNGPGGAGPRHVPAPVLARYDLNKDGALDDAERAAFREDIHSGKLPRPGFGPNAGGQPAPTAKQLLEKFDSDKDGKLDETELTAFLDSKPAHGPLHRRGGPGRPGPAAEPPQN